MTAMDVLRPDPAIYLRTNAWLAAAAMAAGMGILWAIGNPHIWTGAVGGLAAVAFRAWFVRGEELAAAWTLTPTHLEGPTIRPMENDAGAGPAWTVPLSDIATVRTMGPFVQIVTHAGNKHLMKYLPKPAEAAARIDAARRSAGRGHPA